ncbi:uncharacterized protein SAPINGB_P005551 [Magnusiomyces paraingens]|uniref:Elongation factor 1-beta n=1 Tax=Magnusiomyces paraingens TaxID=2606893 RepID=A0A5E8C0A4_9ASCO|nr:uncharacterized protein SAPINGB_P005551 [Saprochaete ingens]VVT57134.1 unnamed protein product [Saprochaete ingens]
MGFSDLTSAAGLKSLDSFLADKSYIQGTAASQADVVVYKAVGSAPDAEAYPNAARWYKHIASYSEEFATLPGDKEASASSFGPEAAAAPAAAAAEEEDDDEEVDLFGSDDDEEEDPEAVRIREERLAAYAAKKAGKPKTIAKSLVTLDIKSWDDTIDLDALLKKVLEIKMDGLVWGGAQFIPIGYGIKKIQLNVVVEDEKVSMDDLSDAIEAFEDEVQSVDVAAMQKI